MFDFGFTPRQWVVVFGILILVWGVVQQYGIAAYGKRGRITKARCEVRLIGMLVRQYIIGKDKLPTTMAELPWAREIPTPPDGGNPPWSSQYHYAIGPGTMFTISASGDGVTVKYP